MGRSSTTKVGIQDLIEVVYYIIRKFSIVFIDTMIRHQITDISIVK